MKDGKIYIGLHYHLHDTHVGKFSIIHDENNYIVKKDHKPIFYNITGIYHIKL